MGINSDFIEANVLELFLTFYRVFSVLCMCQAVKNILFQSNCSICFVTVYVLKSNVLLAAMVQEFDG